MNQKSLECHCGNFVFKIFDFSRTNRLGINCNTLSHSLHNRCFYYILGPNRTISPVSNFSQSMSLLLRLFCSTNRVVKGVCFVNLESEGSLRFVLTMSVGGFRWPIVCFPLWFCLFYKTYIVNFFHDIGSVTFIVMCDILVRGGRSGKYFNAHQLLLEVDIFISFQDMRESYKTNIYH